MVTKWTGREAGLLRFAMRKSGKEIAELVGVNPRQVTRWEGRGETLSLSLLNQAALDTLLARASPEDQQRFAALLTDRAAAEHDERAEELLRTDPRTSRHPGDGKLMVLVEEGIHPAGAENRSLWLDAFRIDLYPTTNSEYERFVQATGHRPPQHSGRKDAALPTWPPTPWSG
ncbi:hypothetical protein [Streptomyces sp. NPDC059906]|uniref:hypothetical protein n=1 Tax=Streptomyces sp. NPDC059906 TaxID=3346997 RepID=UPI00364A5F41